MPGYKAETPQQSHLHRLPAELRIRIYDYALVSDTPIRVSETKKSKDQPGLLRSCSQFRHEASTVYYTLNKFVFMVDTKLNGLKSTGFCNLLHKYSKRGTANLTAEFIDPRKVRIHKDVLFAWLKAYHCDEQSVAVPAQDMEDLEHDSLNIVVRMFAVCDAMRNKPWKRVVPIMLSFDDAIMALETLTGDLLDFSQGVVCSSDGGGQDDDDDDDDEPDSDSESEEDFEDSEESEDSDDEEDAEDESDSEDESDDGRIGCCFDDDDADESDVIEGETDETDGLGFDESENSVFVRENDHFWFSSGDGEFNKGIDQDYNDHDDVLGS